MRFAIINESHPSSEFRFPESPPAAAPRQRDRPTRVLSEEESGIPLPNWEGGGEREKGELSSPDMGSHEAFYAKQAPLIKKKKGIALSLRRHPFRVLARPCSSAPVRLDWRSLMKVYTRLRYTPNKFSRHPGRRYRKVRRGRRIKKREASLLLHLSREIE